MAIQPTRPVTPAPYQSIQRVASSRDVRITRRMTGDAPPARAPRAVSKTAVPTVGQQVDKILSSAEKALFSLLFSESSANQTVEPTAPGTPATPASPRPKFGGQSLGRTIDIRG